MSTTTRSAARKSTAAAKAAKKTSTRPARVSTAAQRAKTFKVKAAKEGQTTVYEMLKNIWSVRGEILVDVGGHKMELKKADAVRVLKNLPRDAASPFTLKSISEKAHVLA